VEVVAGAALEVQSATKSKKRPQPYFLLWVASWRVAAAAADAQPMSKQKALLNQEGEVEKADEDAHLAACDGLATNEFLLWPAQQQQQQQQRMRSKAEAV